MRDPVLPLQHKSIECKLCDLLFFCLTVQRARKASYTQQSAKRTHQKAQTQNYSHKRYQRLLCVCIYIYL